MAKAKNPPTDEQVTAERGRPYDPRSNPSRHRYYTMKPTGEFLAWQPGQEATFDWNPRSVTKAELVDALRAGAIFVPYEAVLKLSDKSPE